MNRFLWVSILGFVLLLLVIGVGIFLIRPSSTPSLTKLTKLTKSQQSSKIWTVLVHSFDGYCRYWPGFCFHWSKFFEESTMPIYFSREEMSVKEKIKPLDHKNLMELPTTKGSPWGTRLKQALDQIPSHFEYILHLQEDMWLTDPLSFSSLQQKVEHMQQEDWLTLKLFNNCDHVVGHPQQWANSLYYIISHQPSFWKRSFLNETIKMEDSPFQHETRLNIQLHQAKNKNLASRCRCEAIPFRYYDVSRQGKISSFGRAMLNKAGLSFDIEPHEILVRKTESIPPLTLSSI